MPSRRARLLLTAWLLALPAAAFSCEVETTRDTLLGAGAFGEIRLGSGRAVVLGDIRPAGEGEAMRAFLDGQGEAEVELRLDAREPDRWGRLRAGIVLAPDSARLDLAHALVARGAALVDPAGRALCDTSLLLREEQARRARRGLWREEAALPLEAAEPQPLLERVGEFAIVEGLVRGVGERGRSTFIDFDRAWDGSFTVIVPRGIWSKARAAGMEAESLEGRRIRVRGIMQNWRGPAIELTAVELLEMLESRP